MSSISKIDVNGTVYDIESKDAYSTTEQVIGTWIDGKPLYRKVFEHTATQLETFIDVTAFNIDIITKLVGTCKAAKSTYNQYPTYWKSSSDYFAMFFVPGSSIDKLMVQVGTTWPATNASIKIIIEYTKTTDTANN